VADQPALAQVLEARDGVLERVLAARLQPTQIQPGRETYDRWSRT
jgi:hypothetical protein